MDVEQMAEETKSSILGSVVCRKFAGSVPYFDSSFHPNEFRVVFVLGGPGGTLVDLGVRSVVWLQRTWLETNTTLAKRIQKIILQQLEKALKVLF